VIAYQAEVKAHEHTIILKTFSQNNLYPYRIYASRLDSWKKKKKIRNKSRTITVNEFHKKPSSR